MGSMMRASNRMLSILKLSCSGERLSQSDDEMFFFSTCRMKLAFQCGMALISAIGRQ